MWYLLLVFSFELAGLDNTYLLKPKDGDGYPTQEACLEAQYRVQKSMNEAYPDEIHKFKLACVNPAIKDA